MLIAIIILVLAVSGLSALLYVQRRNNYSKVLELKSELNAYSLKINELEKNNEIFSASLEQKGRIEDELRQQLERSKAKNSGIMKHLLVLRKTILPEINYIKSVFPDFFVLDMPSENAGGDFYYFYSKDNISLICSGNCGATGINGLVKSLLNVVFLKEISLKNDLSKISSGQILDMLRGKYAHLSDSGEFSEENPPVNITVCIIDKKEKTLEFSGAYSSLCLIRKSYPGTSRKEVDVHEFVGDKMNFAVSFGRSKNYSTEKILLEKEDKIYLKTDGFALQRNPEGVRFGDSAFMQMLLKHSSEPMIQQKNSFKEDFESYRLSCRANDVLLIGIALKIKSSSENISNKEVDYENEKG
ncbi:MAG: SpoIIE family protein phosphatase [Bacteroidales bacterium]|nr:SpoIIE family protein phosphatase [Bacteroidales bacterium]